MKPTQRNIREPDTPLSQCKCYIPFSPLGGKAPALKIMHSHPVVPIVWLCLLLPLAFTLAACGGGSGGSSGGGTHPPQPAELLYAAGLGGAIETFDIDMSSGSLAGNASSTGSNGLSIAVNAANTFLYAADPSTNAVDGFSISSAGVLSTMAGSPFPAPGAGLIMGVAVDPAGKFLYATTETASGGTGIGLLAVFSIDNTTGALSPTTGSPFSAGITPAEVVVAPSGQFLYISDSGSGILAFSLAAGAPTLISGSPFPGGTQGVSMTPSGAYLYAISIDNEVWAYSIDSTTGSLAQLSNSPFVDPAGTGDFTGAIVVDPTGSFLYTYNTFGFPNTISGFAIDKSTGTLSVMPSSPLGTGQPTFFGASLAIEPSGKFLYASCADSNCGILAFDIDTTTGALTPVTGSPFDAVNFIGGMATVRAQ
jgi:6-phosphogluconolactonase (cycloisomerase 2 family)